LTFIEDSVLAKVLFFEVGKAIRLNIALENELSNVIITLTSENLTWGSNELVPSHMMILSILCVSALPD
jgi:hypothetical protein